MHPRQDLLNSRNPGLIKRIGPGSLSAAQPSIIENGTSERVGVLRVKLPRVTDQSEGLVQSVRVRYVLIKINRTRLRPPSIQSRFGIVERQASRRGVFKSVKDLNAKIRTFIDGWNARSHPFVWTKTAKEILKKANRPTTSNPRH